MNVFNQTEKEVLISFQQKGGILIQISNYPGEPANILEINADGDFEAIGTLDEEISIKLFELYPDPTPMGYHLLGLKTCIKDFC